MESPKVVMVQNGQKEILNHNLHSDDDFVHSNVCPKYLASKRAENKLRNDSNDNNTSMITATTVSDFYKIKQNESINNKSNENDYHNYSSFIGEELHFDNDSLIAVTSHSHQHHHHLSLTKTPDNKNILAKEEETNIKPSFLNKTPLKFLNSHTKHHQKNSISKINKIKQQYDIYQRKQTPKLRWSKKFIKHGSRKFNAAIFRPILKGSHLVKKLQDTIQHHNNNNNNNNNNEQIEIVESPLKDLSNIKPSLDDDQHYTVDSDEDDPNERMMSLSSDDNDCQATKPASSGLTGQFKAIKFDIQKNNENDNILIKKKLRNPLKDFKKKYEMQKCSSAYNILKASFSNRISLSPIQLNSVKFKEGNSKKINKDSPTEMKTKVSIPSPPQSPLISIKIEAPVESIEMEQQNGSTSKSEQKEVFLINSCPFCECTCEGRYQLIKQQQQQNDSMCEEMINSSKLYLLKTNNDILQYNCNISAISIGCDTSSETNKKIKSN
jgi:hypothetical protein